MSLPLVYSYYTAYTSQDNRFAAYQVIQDAREGKGKGKKRPRISDDSEDDDPVPVLRRRAKRIPFSKQEVDAIRTFLAENNITCGKVSLLVCQELLDCQKLDRTPKQVQDKIKQLI